MGGREREGEAKKSIFVYLLLTTDDDNDVCESFKFKPNKLIEALSIASYYVMHHRLDWWE